MNEYSTRGELFIREVCADVSGRYLEQLSGVTQLMANVNVDDFEDDDFEPVEDTDTLDKES